MTTPRKPRPVRLTREDVEAMIAEAVQAERVRSEQAMAAALLAIGAAAQTLEGMATALLEAERMIDVHAGLIGPMAEAFSAATDFAEAAAAADPSTVN